jgi:hypothetical protein
MEEQKYAQLEDQEDQDQNVRTGGDTAKATLNILLICCTCCVFLPLLITQYVAWVYIWTREVPLLKECDATTYTAWCVAFI